MARPLRFRHSPETWNADRVRAELYDPLNQNLGARQCTPHYAIGRDGWETVRFEMDNGDVALFCWSDGDGGYWMGNTETPSTLWRTDKYDWESVPYHVSRWAQRELLADLHEAAPWLRPYEYVSWFFLPVFMSKDGRETTRAFFDDHAAGFPDATREEALSFYESVLRTGVLDDDREEMAGKLGTSESLDVVRMSSAMSEFTVAWLLTEAGYEVTPEIEVTTGHSLDFAAGENGRRSLVEVTRPRPPTRRAADTPVAAVRDTAETKTNGQLSEHGGGATLLVDCSSFRDDEWQSLRGEQPDVRHRPAVVFRARPDGRIEGYRKGAVPLDFDGVVDWV